MNQIDLLERVDYLLKLGNKALETKRFVEFQGDIVEAGEFIRFRSAALSFIKNLYGEQHIYYLDFNKRTASNKTLNLKVGISIIKSIRDEVENGWLFSIKKLVSADIFSDFLEMAGYLLDEGYKDAAAVMIGSVLEKQLRSLCETEGVPITFIRNGIKVPKKSNLLIAELFKADILSRLDHKNVTAWLDLRNSAAHGHYNDYTKEEVSLMYTGVSNFLFKN